SRRGDPAPDRFPRPRADQGAPPRGALAPARRGARREGPRPLRGARGAARGRPQDRERRDGAGLRAARLPRRYPHPPARGALGPVLGPQRRSDRARPEAPVPAGHLGDRAPPDDPLRADPLSRARARSRALPDLLLGRAAPPREARAGSVLVEVAERPQAL